MKSKTQILIIHGGMTFKNKKDYLHYLRTRKVSLESKANWGWPGYLEKNLGKGFHIIRPRMPQSDDAKYEDWKIHFERHIPLLKNGVILLGNSLGGIFLAKYLSEHKFPKKIKAVFLTCAPFDGTHSNEDLAGGFKLRSDLSLIEKNTEKLTMFFSEDDECVPVYHAEEYRKKLPNAKIVIYKSKNGHFNVPTFPEIIKMIKSN